MGDQSTMNILAIETSCDETSAAVVRDGRFVLSNIVASQAQIHAKYGGVVPEVAARKHVEMIVPVIDEALTSAGCTKNDVNLIAVTTGPGLITSLLVGVDAAKSLGFAWDKRIIPVHHIKGHIYANQILEYEGKKVERSRDFIFPIICLTVSGGHSDLVLLRSHQEFEKIGSTVDDAAGEAFDKVAALLGLGYPGGPAVSAQAEKGNRDAISFPSPMIHQDNFDFSFSGLKTAVRQLVETEQKKASQGNKGQLDQKTIQDICASFEKAVARALLEKTFRAVQRFGVKKVILSGGVAANRFLRDEFERRARETGVEFSFPPITLCTDNAAMIGAAAFFQSRENFSYRDIAVRLSGGF